MQQSFVVHKTPIHPENKRETADSSIDIIYFVCARQIFRYYDEVAEMILEIIKEIENPIEKMFVMYLKYSQHLLICTYENMVDTLMEGW